MSLREARAHARPMPRLRVASLLLGCAVAWAEEAPVARHSVTLKLKQAAPRSHVSFLELGLQSRAHARLRAHAKLAGPPRTEFFTTLSLGTPPQTFLVALDTGSGNIVLPSRQCEDMACEAHHAFDRFLSTSAKDVIRITEKPEEHAMINWPPRGDAEKLTLFYGTGKVAGPMVNDRVCIGPMTPGDHLCTRMNFVVGDSMSQEPFGLLPFDGVLGLGLVELSASPEFNMMGQFGAKEAFKKDCFALWLAHKEDGEDSEVTFGDFKPERIASRIVWAKISNHPGRSGRSGFWQTTVQDIAVGNVPLGFGKNQAAIDTGTSVLAMPSSMKGALEAQLGMKNDCSDLKTLPTLGFVVEGVILNLEPTDYMLKSGDNCYPQFMSIDLPPPKGPMLLLGDPFLRKYYTIFDRDSLKLGFALAVHNSGNDQVDMLAWAKRMMVVTD